MKQETDKYLYGALANASSNTYALVNGRVYNKLAPERATKPYVVFSLNSGGETNDTQRDRGDLFYTLLAIDDDDSVSDAIADAIRADLHEAGPVSLDNGWVLTDVKRTAVLSQLDTADTITYYLNGGTYRHRLVKET